MKKIKLVLTASGAPGSSTLIKMLKNNGEREIEIVGTDANPEVIGRFWCDGFYTVPVADAENYIDSLYEIVQRERPDILFPVSSAEVQVVADNLKRFEELGVKVLVSSSEALITASNKYTLYETLKQDPSIQLPLYHYPQTLEEFIEDAHQLGYPEKPVCFKPPVSKGGRGFRIINDQVSRRDLLLNYKPESKYISMREFEEIFQDDDFPKLLLMEVVEGPEIDVMTLCRQGRALLTTAKTRELSRWGIITKGETIYTPELNELTQKIISLVPLSYNVGLQFIGNKLIEINPRVSTFIYQDDLIEPYLSIKLILGEITEEEVIACSSRIRYGRKMVRYMDQVFWD